MSTTANLRVHEVFHTWQGEGVFMGRAAFFIRLYGCPLRCDFCDSAGTWHPDHKPEQIKTETAEALAQQAADSGAPICVITGGEPAMYDISALTSQLSAKGIRVHIETSGAFPIRGDCDWLTVSPKFAKLPTRDNLFAAHELKIIVTEPGAILHWEAKLSEVLGEDFSEWVKESTKHEPGFSVWLHPEWSQRGSIEILKRISTAVKDWPRVYRAGYQLHKLYAVDSLDIRAIPAVPLGGTTGDSQ